MINLGVLVIDKTVASERTVSIGFSVSSLVWEHKLLLIMKTLSLSLHIQTWRPTDGPQINLVTE